MAQQNTKKIHKQLCLNLAKAIRAILKLQNTLSCLYIEIIKPCTVRINENQFMVGNYVTKTGKKNHYFFHRNDEICVRNK